MPPAAITVESLGKAYRIGLKEEVPDTLVGAATGWLKTPLRNLQNLRRLNTFTANHDDQPDLIWALRDVSFEVPEGEVLGVIGRNGAGKSTLLKILSRITEPTRGRAVIHGRVSSLLEVGTGFHQELSGRENIYMNGTILGMRKREIDRKLEQIIDFSGVEKFLDTPIKRYSSGMKVRLAFAVAAHLEPEILIIDEVLAVGDAEFQKKCLGKMHDVAQGGRTVLFVSHNMDAVAQLTHRALLLNNGSLYDLGPTEEILAEYLQLYRQQVPQGDVQQSHRRNPDLKREIEFIQLSLQSGSTPIAQDDELVINARLRVNSPVPKLRVSGTLFSLHGQPIGSFFSNETNISGRIEGELFDVSIPIGNLSLAPGEYQFGLATGAGNETSGHRDYDIISDCLCFEVVAPRSQGAFMSIWPRNWGYLRIPSPRLEIL